MSWSGVCGRRWQGRIDPGGPTGRTSSVWWRRGNALRWHVVVTGRSMSRKGADVPTVRSEGSHRRPPPTPRHLQTRIAGVPVRLMMRAPSCTVLRRVPTAQRTHECSGERELISTLGCGEAQVNSRLRSATGGRQHPSTCGARRRTLPGSAGLTNVRYRRYRMKRVASVASRRVCRSREPRCRLPP
jgi:hypothetical protein